MTFKLKWDVDKANGVMWVASDIAKSLCGSMKDKTGIHFIEHMCYVHDHLFEWCTLEEENVKVGSFLVKRFKDRKFADNFVKEYTEFDKETIKEMNELDKKDFSKLSNDEVF